jgi:hypothetical protein
MSFRQALPFLDAEGFIKWPFLDRIFTMTQYHLPNQKLFP